MAAAALALLSLVGAALSTVFWMVNPVTAIFGHLGGYAVRLIGLDPPFDTDYTAIFVLSFLWPLLIWPGYAVNRRYLGGRGWSLGLALAGAFFLAGFGVQLWRSFR